MSRRAIVCHYFGPFLTAAFRHSSVQAPPPPPPPPPTPGSVELPRGWHSVDTSGEAVARARQKAERAIEEGAASGEAHVEGSHSEAATASSIQRPSDGGDIAATNEAGEVLRWVQQPEDKRIVDEKGEYIVSRTKWYTGELAYKTPPAPTPLEPRFGYQIVSVKKPITWWQHYRKNPQWSWAHVNIHVVFGIGVVWLTSFLTDEIRNIQAEQMRPHGLVGTQLGKGRPEGRNRKIAFSAEETAGMMQQAQEAYMNGNEMTYAGSKDYQMKKIPRPKEFSVDDVVKLGNQPRYQHRDLLAPKTATESH